MAVTHGPAVYKVASGPNAVGAWWWPCSGPFIYLPPSSGIGANLQDVGFPLIDITAAWFTTMSTAFGTTGGP